MENIIIQISIQQLIGSSIIVIILVSLIQFLFSVWIKSRLEKSIQHEYDKKLEEYRFSQLQRQKAEIIAKFFAKWIKFRGKEKQFLDKDELLKYYEELNQMSFEISLWIADNKILNDIMDRFQNKENSKDIRQLIGEFRKLTLNIKDDKFNIQKITIWPTDDICKELELIDK